jgi:hypothetical protein
MYSLALDSIVSFIVAKACSASPRLSCICCMDHGSFSGGGPIKTARGGNPEYGCDSGCFGHTQRSSAALDLGDRRLVHLEALLAQSIR